MAEETNLLIDVDEGLARVRGNQMIYRKMLGLFLQSTEFDELEAALGKQDYPKAQQLAHTIKGMTGNLSLTRIFLLSTQLMTQLKDGPPNDATLADYRAALEATKTAVEAKIAEPA